jgi:hypothetical protein
VAFYESLALKLQKVCACFVRLGHPHAEYGGSVGMSESADEGGVVPEMMIECGPLQSDGRLHGALIPRAPLKLRTPCEPNDVTTVETDGA